MAARKRKSADHTFTVTVSLASELKKLVKAFGLSEADTRNYFEFQDFVTLELTVDAKLTVLSGRILPLTERPSA